MPVDRDILILYSRNIGKWMKMGNQCALATRSSNSNPLPVSVNHLGSKHARWPWLLLVLMFLTLPSHAQLGTDVISKCYSKAFCKGGVEGGIGPQKSEMISSFSASAHQYTSDQDGCMEQATATIFGPKGYIYLWADAHVYPHAIGGGASCRVESYGTYLVSSRTLPPGTPLLLVYTVAGSGDCYWNASMWNESRAWAWITFAVIDGSGSHMGIGDDWENLSAGSVSFGPITQCITNLVTVSNPFVFESIGEALANTPSWTQNDRHSQGFAAAVRSEFLLTDLHGKPVDASVQLVWPPQTVTKTVIKITFASTSTGDYQAQASMNGGGWTNVGTPLNVTSPGNQNIVVPDDFDQSRKWRVVNLSNPVVEVGISTAHAFEHSFPTIKGVTYQWQKSSDLKNWIADTVPFQGSGFITNRIVTPTTSASGVAFWRLKCVQNP